MRVKNEQAMCDKTAIEKAKKALEAIVKAHESLRTQCYSNQIYNAWHQEISVYDLNEAERLAEIALAALEAEKPAVDNDAYDVAMEILSLGNSESTPANISDKIETFAESYHAEQCRSCKK